MATESIAYRKALTFAKRIVNLCRFLQSTHQDYVLSKQILRSGTSIGANIAEHVAAAAVRTLLPKFTLH